MSDIFISYASADRATAKSLAELLKQRGWSVWWDRVIPIGKTFDRVIEEALDSAKCVLVLWSKSSVTSDWVITEADEGLNRGVLIPVKIEETKIPLGFRRLQTANLIGWQAGQENPEVTMMLEAITQIVGAPLLEVPSKFELGNELKLVKTPKAKAGQVKATRVKAVPAKTVFQKELLQLVEYAKNHFREIKGEKRWERGDGAIVFESKFPISEASDTIITCFPKLQCTFQCDFEEDTERRATALFDKKVSEIKSVLDRGWAFEIKGNQDDLSIKNFVGANAQDELGILMVLYKVSDTNYHVTLHI